jgi:hypothetical protein
LVVVADDTLLLNNCAMGDKLIYVVGGISLVITLAAIVIVVVIAN